MKKSFVINLPRPGRSTVTMVTHVYDQVTKRTRTVYLGSFSVGLDPDAVPLDGSIPRGCRRAGISVSSGSAAGLGPEDLAVIRDWLEVHGSHRREQALRRALLQAEQDRQAQARELLLRQLEAELRPRIESEVREAVERERRASELGPLEAAEAALAHASEYVVQRSAQLRAEQHRVTSVRSAVLKTGPNATPLDVLQVQANRVRISAVERFETSCKTAGIMGNRSRRRVSS